MGSDTNDDKPPADPTPGRPKSSGSRQQTLPEQSVQSGSPSTDDKMTQGSGGPVPWKPAGAK
jgi:hypothetical protein